MGFSLHLDGTRLPRSSAQLDDVGHQSVQLLAPDVEKFFYPLIGNLYNTFLRRKATEAIMSVYYKV